MPNCHCYDSLQVLLCHDKTSSRTLPSKTIGAIVEHLQNRRALKKQSSKFWPVSITTPVNAGRKRREKHPTDCLTASRSAISPPANLFHSSHLFSPLLFHCSFGFFRLNSVFLSFSISTLLLVFLKPPFILLTLSFNSFLNATLFSFFFFSTFLSLSLSLVRSLTQLSHS